MPDAPARPPGSRRRKLSHQLEDVGVAGQPVGQDLAGGHSVLRGRLSGRHIATVRQDHWSPGGLAGRCPPPDRCSTVTPPQVTLRRRLMSCMTHVNLPFCTVSMISIEAGVDAADRVNLARCGFAGMPHDR